MAETARAFVWIRSEAIADSQLVAAASGGIHKGVASIGVITPFMSYGRQAGSDRLTLAAVRIWTDILMLIQMVGPSSSEVALEAGADRIDALFKDRRNVAIPGGGGSVLACYREQEVAYDDPQPVNGVQWSHLGGLYRIELQSF
jgi:hypothetical protein